MYMCVCVFVHWIVCAHTTLNTCEVYDSRGLVILSVLQTQKHVVHECDTFTYIIHV